MNKNVLIMILVMAVVILSVEGDITGKVLRAWGGLPVVPE